MKRNMLLKLPLLLLAAASFYASAVLAIDTPRDLRGTEVRQHVVKWEWAPVSGAQKYQITVDGRNMGSTGNTMFYTYDMYPGEYTMYVQAVGNDGSVSAKTPTARIRTSIEFVYGRHGRSVLIGDTVPPNVSATISPPPVAASQPNMVSGLRFEELGGGDVRWQWTSYSGASKYQTTIDGKVAGETANTEWISRALWNGEHSLTVKALGRDGRWTEQSNTLKIVTNGISGVAQATPPQAETPLPSPPPPQQLSFQGGDVNAASVESLIDPASWNYSEVSNKQGYELVFSDEFNGTALNPYRWHSQLRWDGEWNGERYEYRIINNEAQFYVNVLSEDEEHKRDIAPVHNPFKFDGNRLAIQAIRNPLKDREKTRTHGKLDDIVHQQEFLSGALSTHEKFSQKYGYFEARIKIPSHVGTFPAFWLFHSRRAWEGTQRTEIDIMENLGHAPQYIYNSFHYFTNVSRTYGGDANFVKPKPNGQIFTGIDYSQDYHTYAVEWEPGKVTWFIDGVQTSELYRGEVDFEELYLMINLAMGGNWTNFPKNAGGLGRPNGERFPTQNDVNTFQSPQLEIDYVRVYKRR